MRVIVHCRSARVHSHFAGFYGCELYFSPS
jgi:hypothetical protein